MTKLILPHCTYEYKGQAVIIEPKEDYKVLKQYLAQRGLTNEMIYQRVGIELAGPIKCRQAIRLPPDSMDKRIGIIYHYPTTPGEEHYASVRWFGRYVGAFGQVADIKLQCPSGYPVRAYVSPLTELTDGGDVYICESVLKAIVLSQTGRYCIGGNGVSCFYVRGEFVPGFPVDEISRAGRVIILFDNDVKTNPNVAAARRRLTEGLRNRWPNLPILWADLPNPPGGGKWGIDDFIASGGDVSKIILEDAAATELERMMDELNETYSVCAFPPCIIKKETGNVYSRADFTGLLESHRRIWVGEKLVEGSKIWLGDGTRSSVKRIVYLPGGDRCSEGEFYNTWRDDGAQAIEGDVQPFLMVYENAVPDGTARTLLLQSFAWILQNRGKKLEKTFVFVSRQVGTGKSLFALTMSKILGARNSASIDMADFSSDFNAVFAAKELVVIDDLHKVNKADVARLRRYTTSLTTVVNEKNVKRYEIDNMAVFVLTTNELSAVPMDDEERRNLVVSFDPVVHHTGDGRWWKDYVAWLEDGGYGKIRFWLEHMDLTAFDPYYTPPLTEIKAKMVATARSPEDNFVYDLFTDYNAVLGTNQRSVYTTEELWFLYAGGPPGPGDLVRLGRALANKFNYAAEGRLGRYFRGRGTCRVWQIRQNNGMFDLKAAQNDIVEFPIVSGGAS